MTAPTMTPPASEHVPEPERAGRFSGVVGALRSAGSRMPRPSAGGLLRSPLAVGALAALWAAAISLSVAVLCLVLVWVATPASGLSLRESFRVAGLLWTAAQGTPVLIGTVTYSLLPWGLAILPVVLLAYAGGWAIRRSRTSDLRGLILVVTAGVVTYSLIALVVSQLTSAASAATSPQWAFVHAFALALLAFGFGAGRASSAVLSEAAPAWLLVSARAGAVGTLTILGFGAVAAAVSMLVRVDDAVTMAQSLHAGVWGGLGLLLLGIAYAPVAIVWATSYLLGAGFAIGPAVIVSPFIPVTSPTQLPPFPMLAGIPQSATPIAWALPVVGVVGGVLAGLVISRRARSVPRLIRLLYAVGAAALAGLLLALAATMADGALGDVRLTHLGPSATTVGVLAFVLVLLGALPTALLGRAPRKPDLSVAHAADTTDAGSTPHEETTLVVARQEEYDDV